MTKFTGNIKKFSGMGVLCKAIYEGDTASDAAKLGGKLPNEYATAVQGKKADAAIPKSGGAVVTGDLAPAVARGASMGATSKPWDNVVSREIYAHGGRLISRNPANMEGDYVVVDYVNHKVLNSHGTDAMKLCSNPGIFAMNIGTSGFVEIKAAAFTQVSSVRYKDILGDMTRERARKVLDLDLIKYRYKPEVDDNPKTRYGIKAEQADELELWDLVEYSVHDGQPEAVDYSKLAPYLVGIAKDHNAKIERLEAGMTPRASS